MNGGKTKQRYLDWWVNDLPPMHGFLRFVIYGGLFVLAWQMYKSPLRGITLYEATDPELFRSFGLIKFLGIPYIAPEHLRTVIAVTSVAWICAAIGLLTRVSAAVTALGVCFLHGLFLGSNALNHNYFLPMYALIALCFARTNDAWSVDYHLKKWWKGSPPISGTGLIDTGFARKAFLVATVGYYFSAGITKLMVAGPIWADGHTIAYFAEQRGGRYPLGAMLSEHLWLCTILGVGTVVLEAGSIMALLSRKARLALIFGWTLMHIGIRITVGPYYWENILCFALLIDWGAAVRAIGKRLPLRPRMLIEQTIGPTNKLARLRAVQVGALSRRANLGLVAAGFLVPLVLVVAFFQVFWWPLTNVYMYCSYFSQTRSVRADHPRADYYEAAAAQHIAREFLESQPPIEATEYFAFRAGLRLAGGGLGPGYFRGGAAGNPAMETVDLNRRAASSHRRSRRQTHGADRVRSLESRLPGPALLNQLSTRSCQTHGSSVFGEIRALGTHLPCGGKPGGDRFRSTRTVVMSVRSSTAQAFAVAKKGTVYSVPFFVPIDGGDHAPPRPHTRSGVEPGWQVSGFYWSTKCAR